MKLYGEVPPLTLTKELPVELPKQLTFICPPMALLSGAEGWVMVTFRVEMQPLASVMEQVQVPAGRLLADAPDCGGTVFQEKPYGAVPPLALTVALPVLLPKQFTFA